MTELPRQMRRLVTQMREDGTLHVRLETLLVPQLATGEVLIRVEAAPLHPSDLGMMLLAGDLSRAESVNDTDSPCVRMPVPEFARAMMLARVGMPAALGNEGSGTIIAAGDAAEEALIGRKVAVFGGGMYADYRVISRDRVMPLPEGVSVRDGAAASVNPLTALAMVEVMRSTGAKALVNTAAASSLGQILQRICTADGIPLVNIVRRPEQEAILRDLGATHILNSADPQFMSSLVQTFAEVDATIAFDAVGGGTLAGTILTAMETAQNLSLTDASPYGSAIPKHVYLYGRLDPSPTLVPPSVGMAWGLGGFLLPHFLAGAGRDVEQRMIERVMRELQTTFAIHYTVETGLAGLLDPDLLQRANAKTTNDKILIRPQD